MEHTVCFAGHRNHWDNVGIELKLYCELEKLIQKGYTTFFDGGYGDFDKLAKNCIMRLQKQYPHIKSERVLAYFNPNKIDILQNSGMSVVVADIGDCYIKNRITKRNEWLVDNSDVIVCHIKNTYKSGAYKTYLYAVKKGKTIIQI